MIETGEVRKLFTGPPEVTATLIHPARVLLGEVKNDMAFNRLSQGERRLRWPVDQRLLSYSDSPERTIEVRAEGIAEISAGSRFGQDWIAIDATAVTITIIPTEGGEYIPYLWIGVRSLLTEWPDGSYDFNTMQFTQRWPYAMLNVFEPAPTDGRRPQFVSSRGAWVTTFLFKELYPAGDERTCDAAQNLFNCGALNAEPLCDVSNAGLSSQLGDPFFNNDESEYVNIITDAGVAKVWYTDRNLYLLGHLFAWDPEDPDAAWEQVVILDPQDPPKTWRDSWRVHIPTTAPGPVSDPFFPGAWTQSGTAPAGPVTGLIDPLEDWSLRGQVLPGEYVVKLAGGSFGTVCDMPDFKVEMEVRLGKPPGQTLKKTFEVMVHGGSYWFRHVIPYGYYDFGHITDTADGLGPNPNARAMWPGSLRIDVANGAIEFNDIDFMDRPEDAGFQLEGEPPYMENSIDNLDCGGCPDAEPVTKEIQSWSPWYLDTSKNPPDLILLPLYYVLELVAEVVSVNEFSELCMVQVIPQGFKATCCDSEGHSFPEPGGEIFGVGMMFPAVLKSSTGRTVSNVGDRVTIINAGRTHVEVVADLDDPVYRPKGYGLLINFVNFFTDVGWSFDVVNGYVVPVTDPHGRPVDLGA